MPAKDSTGLQGTSAIWDDVTFSIRDNIGFCKIFVIWILFIHNDVIKWKHFPCYRPFVWRIQWSLVNSPHKGQWRRALMFSLICAWMNGWVNNREAGDLRCHRTHYDVTVMIWDNIGFCNICSVPCKITIWFSTFLAVNVEYSGITNTMAADAI